MAAAHSSKHRPRLEELTVLHAVAETKIGNLQTQTARKQARENSRSGEALSLFAARECVVKCAACALLRTLI